MPRQARIQSPTDYYHVMMRGNNRENIFSKDEQKLFFLDILKRQEEDQLIDIASYCPSVYETLQIVPGYQKSILI